MVTEDETTNGSVLSAATMSFQFRRITTGKFIPPTDPDNSYLACRKNPGDSGLLAGKNNETSQRGHYNKQTATE
jgi:hypothetical protein